MANALDNLLEKLNEKSFVTIDYKRNDAVGKFIFNAVLAQDKTLSIAHTSALYINNTNVDEKDDESGELISKRYLKLLNVVREELVSIEVSEKFIGVSDKEDLIKISKNDDGFEKILKYLFDSDINLNAELFSLYFEKIQKRNEVKEKVKKK